LLYSSTSLLRDAARLNTGFGQIRCRRLDFADQGAQVGDGAGDRLSSAIDAGDEVVEPLGHAAGLIL
jgi:hypothetical protein